MKRGLHKGLFVLVDFISAVLAWLLFYFLRKQILGEASEAMSFRIIFSAAVIGVFWIGMYAFFGSYFDIYRKSRIKELLKTITFSLIGAVVVFFVLILDDEGVIKYTSYYSLFFTYLFCQFFISALFKVLFLTYIKKQVKDRVITFNSILIGSGSNAIEIFDAVEKNREILGFNFVGYVHLFDEFRDNLKGYLPNLGSFDSIGDLIKKNSIENVIIAVEQCEHQCIDEVLKELEHYNVKVSIIPNIYDLLLGAVKVNHVFSIPLIEINQDLIPSWKKAIKRSIDILFSLSVLLIGSPLYILVAVITKTTSKGPIFYTQERIGKDGIPFKIIKYRSMYIDAETHGPALSSSRDSRITPWGKFMRKSKMDEIPQFYNVLIGDMSLVGPRPERQYFIDKIVVLAPHYRQLQRVKPGVTSLGQVKYGYAENVSQMVKRLKYDIIYIENMSISMDIQIILYTFYIIISGRTK